MIRACTVSLLVALAAGWLASPGAIHAHKPSDAYLSFEEVDGTLGGQLDLALRDLEHAVGLDADLDGAITWAELEARRDTVIAYALARLEMRRGGELCTPRPGDFLVDHHSDGAYAVVLFDLACPEDGAALEVAYQLFFDLDPNHRGLARLGAGSVILSPDRPQGSLALGDTALGDTAPAGRFLAFWREGVWHIWIGFDHILFLVALLLPAVLRREGGTWRAAGPFRPVLWSVIGVVSAFTVAHSITLGLAALDLVRLPSRWVEVTIAATVVLAALNNLVPMFGEKAWRAAFVLGLVHGFGFANVLRDLGLPSDALARALLGFNLGVEAGQLAIVAVFLPCAFLARGTRFYRFGLVGGGSAAVALVALVWLLERSLDWRILPI